MATPHVVGVLRGAAPAASHVDGRRHRQPAARHRPAGDRSRQRPDRAPDPPRRRRAPAHLPSHRRHPHPRHARRADAVQRPGDARRVAIPGGGRHPDRRLGGGAQRHRHRPQRRHPPHPAGHPGTPSRPPPTSTSSPATRGPASSWSSWATATPSRSSTTPAPSTSPSTSSAGSTTAGSTTTATASFPPPPTRVADTRTGTGGVPTAKIGAGASVDLPVAASCPAGATVGGAQRHHHRPERADPLHRVPVGRLARRLLEPQRPGRGDAGQPRPWFSSAPTGRSPSATTPAAADAVVDLYGCYGPPGAELHARVGWCPSNRRASSTRATASACPEWASCRATASRSRPSRSTGRGGVPSSGVRAVLVNITATDNDADTHLSVAPSAESLGPLDRRPRHLGAQRDARARRRPTWWRSSSDRTASSS